MNGRITLCALIEGQVHKDGEAEVWTNSMLPHTMPLTMA